MANGELKIIFFLQLILSAWGAQGLWSPNSYMFYSLIFLFTLLWIIHEKESQEPLAMGIYTGGICILLDIIVLSMYYPSGQSFTEQFSAIMAIFNMFVRGGAIMKLSKVIREKYGNLAALGLDGTSADTPAGSNTSAGYDNTGGPTAESEVPPQATGLPAYPFDAGGPTPTNKLPPSYPGFN